MEEKAASQGKNRRERSVESIVETCREMIRGLRMDLVAEGSEKEGDIHINISGEDRPYLLSNSASLLNCLEYLINRIYRGGRDEGGIILDSDGYRLHREAELMLLAQMASKKVLTMRKPLGLQPMTARERRIVHLALADIEGVQTKSTGEGENRSITIYPS